MKIISLEDHFTTALHKEKTRDAARQVWYADRSAHLGHDIEAQLMDVDAGRIAAMDAAGISVQVLSLTTPGCQAFPGPEATELARDANDAMAAAVMRHPGRLLAFAALPTANVQASVDEFERTLAMNFLGAMINGHTMGSFLDDRKYWPIFELAAARGVPIYLHPGAPHPGLMQSYFAGYQDLARPAWGFAIDASTHFLRMLFAGVFDAFPKLQIILGHLGEGIPFGLHRLLDHTPYVASHRGLKKSLRDCFRENLVVTTSGAFSAEALRCTIDVMGIDNVMFSVDWPYESNLVATGFLHDFRLSHDEKEKLAFRNAERVLGL